MFGSPETSYGSGIAARPRDTILGSTGLLLLSAENRGLNYVFNATSDNNRLMQEQLKRTGFSCDSTLKSYIGGCLTLGQVKV